MAFLGVFVVDAAISGDYIGYVNTCNRLGGEELTIWNDISHIEWWNFWCSQIRKRKEVRKRREKKERKEREER